MAEQFSRRINLYIDSGDAQKSYDTLVAKQTKLNESIDLMKQKQQKAMADVAAGNKNAQKEVDTLTTKINKETEALTKVTDAMARQHKKITGELAPSFRDLQSTVSNLGRELKKMSEQDEGFAQKKQQYNEARAALDKYSSSLMNIRNSMSEMLKTAKGVAVGVLVGNTIDAAVQTVLSNIRGTIDAVTKRSDEEANIRKTTNLTPEQIKELRPYFKELDSRTDNSKLAQYASDAGKMGKEGVEDIKRFVNEANQISVALGEDLGDEAITQIGKVADIFDTSMLKIGSSINTIGQSSSASEKFITEFLFRMSGIGKTANISAADILGFGAVLDMNGQQVEASSTALQGFFINFVKDIDKFGKTAGMADGQLKKLADQKGVNVAFIEFLKNLKATSTGADDFLNKLSEMGIDGQRGATAFLTLANNIGEVEKQQAIANKSFNEGVSITKEYEIRNDNLAGRVEKLKKAWAGLFSSNAATSVVEGLVTVGEKAISVMVALPKYVSENRNYFILLASAILLYNRALLANAIQTAYNNVLFRAQYAWLLITEASTKGLAIATNLYSFAQGVLTGRITMAVAIQRIQNALSIASGNIFTIVATAVIALSTAMALYYANIKKGFEVQKMLNDVKTDAAKKTAEEKASLESLLIIAKNETIAKEQRLEAIKKINQISPEYLKNLTLENINTEEGTKLINAYIIALDKKSTAEAIQSKMTDLKKKLIDQENSSLEDNLKWYNYIGEALISGGNGYVFSNSLIKTSIANKSAETNAIQEQIKALNKLIETKVKSGSINVNDLGTSSDIFSSNGVITADEKKAIDKKLDQLEKFYEEVRKLEDDSARLKLSSNQQEIDAARIKYDQLQKQRVEFEKQGILNTANAVSIKQRIEEIWAEEYARIKKKQAENESKEFDKRTNDEYQASLNSLERYILEEKTKTAKYYSEGKISQLDYNKQIEMLEYLHIQSKINIAGDYYDTSEKAASDLTIFLQAQYLKDIDNARKAAEQKRRDQIATDNTNILNSGSNSDIKDAKLIQLQHNLDAELSAVEMSEAQKTEAIAKANKERIAIQNEYSSQVIGNVKTFTNAGMQLLTGLDNIFNNIENAQLNQDKKKTEQLLKGYEKELDEKILTKQQYDALVFSANERQAQKENELKLRQFNRDKALSLTQAIVNGALAVTSALTTKPFIPLGLASAALAVSMAGAEVGMIASTKAPSFAEGGFTGTSSQNPDDTGERPAGIVHENEFVFDKGYTAHNLAELQFLHRNRIPLKSMMANYMPKSLNIDRTFNAIDFKNGVSNSTASPNSSNSTFVTNNTNSDVSNYLKEQNKLLKEIRDKDNSTTITSFKENERMLKYILKNQL